MIELDLQDWLACGLSLASWKLGMAVLIPTTRLPALTREPQNLFLYGPTKTGKTTIASLLPNALHLDLERGTALVEARRVFIDSPQQLVEVVAALPEAWKASPFDFLVTDTIDVVDDWTDEVALETYRSLPVGKNFTGSTVRELDHGAGWYYIREALKRFLMKLIANQHWKSVFIGHIRDKYADTKLDMATQATDVDLTGKAKSIVCKKMDAIGYVFRDPAQRLIVSFQTRDQLNCGCRNAHLAGKAFLFDTPPRTENWLAIYPDTVAKALQATPPPTDQPTERP